MPTDPIECFQIATCHIAEGDYAGALPLMDRAAEVMAGDPDFDNLHNAVKATA
jgi:hypothetical protein